MDSIYMDSRYIYITIHACNNLTSSTYNDDWLAYLSVLDIAAIRYMIAQITNCIKTPLLQYSSI